MPLRAGKTHRELFDDWAQSLLGRSAPSLIAEEREPVAARAMFERMAADIGGCGGEPACPLTAASYALGYNLAIEYLADYEKRWMLDSFRDMHCRYMDAQGVTPDWVFLEVRPGCCVLCSQIHDRAAGGAHLSLTPMASSPAWSAGGCTATSRGQTGCLCPTDVWKCV